MKFMVWDKIWKIILYIKLRFVGSIEKFSALEQVLGNPQVIWMLTLSLWNEYCGLKNSLYSKMCTLRTKNIFLNIEV